MKRIILTLSALLLSGCGAQDEQGKLCRFFHTCEQPAASPDLL